MTEEQQNSNKNDPWTDDSGPVEKNSNQGEHWEREVLTKLALGSLTEQRRARRWGIFFKLFMVVYLVVFLIVMMAGRSNGVGHGGDHTALIEIKGVIADDAEANADAVVTSLRDAFKDKHTKGIILRINSPGGSPVQAGYINDEIKRLKGLHPDIPVYTVITDLCASGGYYIAVAADKIFADKASIVGSIGVVMGSFGFTGAMDKLGIERRLLTAGESKGFMDPFSPAKPADVKHVHSMLDNIHQQFINVVKEGRGERLKPNDKLFTGLVWTGEQGLELGLVDELGSASYVAREVIGVDNIVDFTQKPDPLERFAERLGVVMAGTLVKITGMETAVIR